MPNPPIPKSLYSEEIVGEILERIMAGESLASILGADRPDGWPSFQVWFRWLAKGSSPDGEPQFVSLVERYTRACAIRAEAHKELILHEADTPRISEIKTARRKTTEDGFEHVEEVRLVDNTERSRLKIDAMKWTMAKMIPKKYGNISPAKADEDDDGTTRIIVENAPDAD